MEDGERDRQERIAYRRHTTLTLSTSLPLSEADECVPCLPVHDSFITFTAYEDTLREAMEMVYEHVMQQQTGRAEPFRIPIK